MLPSKQSVVSEDRSRRLLRKGLREVSGNYIVKIFFDYNRATFEDKILMSDIVFMRTWFKVEPEKFYNPLSSYQDVRLMKTTWELRKDRQIENPINPDSEYKEIVRKKRVFNPLVIPKVFFYNFYGVSY